MSGRAAPVHRLPLLPTTAGTFWLLAVLALLATAMRGTCGRWALSQPWHWASDWAWE